MPRKPNDDTPKTAFAARLIAVRKLYGLQTGRPDLDKKEFAALLPKEAQTYRRYELGETEPNLATLTRIRDLTGVSLNYLIAGQPDVKPEKARSGHVRLATREGRKT
jgi:transcriptional regulator with XRE-family HTH domain